MRRAHRGCRLTASRRWNSGDFSESAWSNTSSGKRTGGVSVACPAACVALIRAGRAGAKADEGEPVGRSRLRDHAERSYDDGRCRRTGGRAATIRRPKA